MLKSQLEIKQSSLKEANAAARLLQRPLPSSYRAQQTAQIAEKARSDSSTSSFTALIFRLGREWLALPAAVCQQILAPVKSHSLPHRSNRTLLGIVNVRGQLLLKVSLLEILGLSEAADVAPAPQVKQSFRGYRRMVVVEKLSEEGLPEVWAFEVDELYGIHSLSFDSLQPVAAGTNASSYGCTQYIFSWKERQVSALNDVKLFDALRQKAL